MSVSHNAICSRCGQAHVTSDTAQTDRATHWVEPDVLDCFNAAYAEACWRGAPTVDLRHLVIAIARHRVGRELFSECGFDPAILIAVVEATLPGLLANPARTSRPSTSADLSCLLSVTRQTATLHGTRYLSLRHVLGTLINPPRILEGGDAVSGWLWAARRYAGGRFAAGPGDTDGHKTALAVESTKASEERQLLLARLERQERLLEALLETRQPTDDIAVRMPPVAHSDDADPLITNDNALLSPNTATLSRTATLSAAVVPLEDIPDEGAPDPTQEPDPELEKLGVRRYYLTLEDEVVRAPSIGPRTAARLQPHGVTHVKHLLTCDPERLSVRLGARHITASRIVAWKNQARLVCTIPWLRGTHAQLLVGAGYSSIEKILSTDRSVVCAAVMQFSTTRDGQSILRAGPPPEIDRIMRWIENSQQSEPQRALTARQQIT